MELKDFIYLIKRKKQTIFTIMVVILAISMAMTFVQPLKYSSTSKIIVVQKFSAGSDPYVTAKSNEYLSNVLSEIIYSNSFFIQVMESGFDVDKAYFEGNALEQTKLWDKTVSARPNAATGMIELEVYHKNKWQAEKISKAIHYTLINKHHLYHGSGSDVQVKVINQPILSKYPVKPNIPLNFSIAILLGFVISMSYIYLLPDPEFDIRVFPGRKKSPEENQENVWLDGNIPQEEKDWEDEALREHEEKMQDTEEYRAEVKDEFRTNYEKYKSKNENKKTPDGNIDNVFGQSNYGG